MKRLQDFFYKIFDKKERTLNIIIPDGFMNCVITLNNEFIADTNNSAEWDFLKFPLPKPKGRWKIKQYKDPNTVILIDKR